MNTLFTLLGDALDDATLAHELLRDAGYRRWLHDDPSAALRVFDGRQPMRTQRDVAHDLTIVSAAA